MPWFRLDEGFHSHPKILKAGNEAIGLYVRCGTYAAEHLTDGFIPEQVALQYGTPALAESLVQSKLWRRVRGGWRMPDYLDYNPSAEQVKKERKQAAERQRRHREESSEKGRRVGRDLPVDNHRESDNSTSGDTLSRRDSRVSHAAPSRAVPVDVVVDVVSLSNGSKRDPPIAVIDAIIKEIHDQTGKLIDPDWASRIAAELVTPGVANPAAYVRQCIRNEPNPGLRFLPQYGRHARGDSR